MTNSPLEATLAGMAAQVHEQISAATASYVINAKNPIIDPGKLIDSAFFQINDSTRTFSQDAIDAAARQRVNQVEPFVRLIEQASKSPAMDKFATQIHDLVGMRQLSQSVTELKLNHQDFGFFQLAGEVANSPEVKKSVSRIVTENSQEDLEEAGLATDADGARLDEVAMEQFASVIRQLENGMDVDWDNVLPLTVAILNAVAVIFSILCPGAGAVVQAGGAALGMTNEVRRKK